MIRSVIKFAKSFDIFGKPISLKFFKNWNTHDTKLGGFFDNSFDNYSNCIYICVHKYNEIIWARYYQKYK